MARKLDPNTLFTITGTGYPAPHDGPCKARENTMLGLAAGLTQFGVNLTRLKPGVWSSQRHWHTKEDEFVYVLEGEVVLVSEEGREVLQSGECVGFRAGVEDGHHFVNESEADTVLLTVGSRSDQDSCHYPDIDMFAKAGRYSGPGAFVHKDGSPYSDGTE